MTRYPGNTYRIPLPIPWVESNDMEFFKHFRQKNCLFMHLVVQVFSCFMRHSKSGISQWENIFSVMLPNYYGPGYSILSINKWPKSLSQHHFTIEYNIPNNCRWTIIILSSVGLYVWISLISVEGDLEPIK